MVPTVMQARKQVSLPSLQFVFGPLTLSYTCFIGVSVGFISALFQKLKLPVTDSDYCYRV